MCGGGSAVCQCGGGWLGGQGQRWRESWRKVAHLCHWRCARRLLPACCPPCCRMKKLMHRVTFPWELKLVNTTDDCPDAGGGGGGGGGRSGPTMSRGTGRPHHTTPSIFSSCSSLSPPPITHTHAHSLADSPYELFAVVVHMGAHPNHGGPGAGRGGAGGQAGGRLAGCSRIACKPALPPYSPCIARTLTCPAACTAPYRPPVPHPQGTTSPWCAPPAGSGCASTTRASAR